MKEEWRELPGFGGNYIISNTGKIMVFDRIIFKRHKSGKLSRQYYKGHLLKQFLLKDNYLGVRFGVNKNNTTIGVHRLVLLAFVGKPPINNECCHNDGNPKNNKLNNLRWDSHYENNQDRKNHGNYYSGENHHFAKLSDNDVINIKKSLDNYYYGLGRKLAKKYGVHFSVISDIKAGRIWKHI